MNTLTGCNCDGWRKADEAGDIEQENGHWLIGHDVIHRHDADGDCPFCKEPLSGEKGR